MPRSSARCARCSAARRLRGPPAVPDRKSTRLNSSHGYISYAVFCLKKKKLVTHSARTGFLYTLERANGAMRLAKPSPELTCPLCIDQKPVKPTAAHQPLDVHIYSAL